MTHRLAQAFVSVTITAGLVTTPVAAQEHVLSLSELHGAISQAAADRHANRAAIDHFFSGAQVRAALKTAGMDANHVRQAATLLDDREQAELAAKARAVESDIAGGELSDAQISLIILAVAGFCYMTVLVLAFK